MSENLSLNNPMGSVNRIKTAENGRVIYQVTDGEGKTSVKLSVNPNDCDRFEKAYNDMSEAGPKLQNFMQNTNEEKLKKLKKTANWILGLSVGLGTAIPIFTTAKFSTFKQVLCTLGGMITGFVAGKGIATAVTTPPGAFKLSKAIKEVQSLDIQAYEE